MKKADTAAGRRFDRAGRPVRRWAPVGHNWHRRPWAAFCVLVSIAALVTGCVTAEGTPEERLVAFESLGTRPSTESEKPAKAGPPPDSSTTMSQAELRELVLRYAASLLASLGDGFRPLLTDLPTPELRAESMRQATGMLRSIISRATGPSAEGNLLDTIVLVTLTRQMFEDYWLPEVFGPRGEPLLAVLKSEEARIWSLAAKVLSAEQQDQLLELIEVWRREHPEQTVAYNVLFLDFAKQYGDSTQEIRPSGLLPEVAEATRAVDEARVLAERLTSYSQLLPRLIVFEAETGVAEILALSESRQLLSDITKFTEAASALSAAVDALPEVIAREREAAIRQTFDNVAAERRRVFEELEHGSETMANALVELRQTLEAGTRLAAHVDSTFNTVDSLVTRLELDKPVEEKDAFKIEDYKETFSEATKTAVEINTLLQVIDNFIEMEREAGNVGPVEDIAKLFDAMVTRWMLIAFGLLVALAFITTALAVIGTMAYKRRALTWKRGTNG